MSRTPCDGRPGITCSDSSYIQKSERRPRGIREGLTRRLASPLTGADACALHTNVWSRTREGVENGGCGALFFASFRAGRSPEEKFGARTLADV